MTERERKALERAVRRVGKVVQQPALPATESSPPAAAQRRAGEDLERQPITVQEDRS